MDNKEYKMAVNYLLTSSEASPLYMQLATCECENLIQRKVERFAGDRDHEYHLRGGDFVTACWNGNTEKAFYHADFENLPALEMVVGVSKDVYLGWNDQ